MIAACNNAEESVTVSGDKDAVDKFVALLQSEGIFAKGVSSSGYASHSHHMLGAVDRLLKALSKVRRSGSRIFMGGGGAKDYVQTLTLRARNPKPLSAGVEGWKL